MPINSQVCIIDANVVIRLFINDHPRFHQKAKEVIHGAEMGKYKLYIDEIVVAEVSWY